VVGAGAAAVSSALGAVATAIGYKLGKRRGAAEAHANAPANAAQTPTVKPAVRRNHPPPVTHPPRVCLHVYVYIWLFAIANKVQNSVRVPDSGVV